MHHPQLAWNQNSISPRNFSKKLCFDQEKYKQLKSAVYHGKRELTETLLREGSPVNYSEDNHDLRSVLHSSIYSGDSDIVKQLLSSGADVNAPNCNDETPLMLAAKMEKYVITDLLLNAKGLRNCRNEENLTHIHIACMRNQVDVMKFLVQSRKDINDAVESFSCSWPGYTPLHFAVQFHCYEMVEYLLSVGADITIKNTKKLTPLHLANMLRDERIIDMILLAHKNTLSNPVDRYGLSHFHIACTRNNTEIVEYFIENGVDIQDEISGNSPFWLNYSAIDFATYYECVDVVKLLLQCGVYVKKPFDEADPKDRIDDADNTGNRDLVHLLTGKIKLRNREMLKIPKLHSSCINEDQTNVEEILSEIPSSLNTLYWRGQLAIHAAIESENENLIQYLLDAGADCFKKNLQGKSFLHLAFERDLRGFTDFILQNSKHFKQNCVDQDGLSHLHIACARDEVEVVKQLIEFGAGINDPVSLLSAFWSGFTPLHFVARFNSIETAQLLLAHGACYWSTDKNNLSPFDIAIERARDILKRDIAFEIMNLILSSHHKSKSSVFNDRGFSRLHLMMTQKDSIAIEDVRQYIKKHPLDLNKTIHKLNSSFDGYSPLHFAIIHGHKDFTKLLLELGADILCIAGNGDTPLSLTFQQWNSDYLMILHDFVREQKNPIDIKNYPFFHLVSFAGDIQLIKYYLDLGVNPNLSNDFGATPLHFIVAKCCYSGFDNAAKLLIEYGANPNATNCRMATPLHYIANESEISIIDALVSYGADVNARDAYFDTPLLSTCECIESIDPEKRVELISALLDNGADINLADEAGTTPLTVDAWNPSEDDDNDEVDEDNEENEFLDVVKVLLKHVIKLEGIGLYVSQINANAYSTLISRYSDKLHFDELFVLNDCDKEIELMKKTRIDRYTTLYDILSKSLNELAVTKENEKFHHIISSEDFLRNFPNYGGMLKSQYRKGAFRKPLLMESQKVLDSLMSITLTDVCTENICQYLSNHDLKNINLSLKKSVNKD